MALPRCVMIVNGIFCMCVQMCFNTRVPVLARTVILWLTLLRNIIQSVSRLVDITAGGDFLDLCDQKKFI